MQRRRTALRHSLQARSRSGNRRRPGVFRVFIDGEITPDMKAPARLRLVRERAQRTPKNKLFNSLPPTSSRIAEMVALMPTGGAAAATAAGGGRKAAAGGGRAAAAKPFSKRRRKDEKDDEKDGR